MRFKSALLIIAGILIMALSACGQAPSGSASGSSGQTGCSGSILGTWEKLPGPSDQVRLYSDCTGTRSQCGEVFTFTQPTSTNGYTNVNVTSTNGGVNCLPLGLTTCGINYNATNMAIDCGSGIYSFTKQ